MAQSVVDKEDMKKWKCSFVLLRELSANSYYFPEQPFPNMTNNMNDKRF